MSHSPLDAGSRAGQEHPYRQAWDALTTMLSEGRSFSGRERHCCFLNTGRRRFAGVSAVSGLDLIDDGRSLAVVDWDHDGDLDFWVTNRGAPMVRFLQNKMTTGNHFLAVHLSGDPDQGCNRDAIGARAELYFDDPTQPALIKTVQAANSYLSQSSKWLHFGLGESQSIARLVVRWPGGKAEEFTDLQVDHRYRIAQGERPVVWTPPRPAPVELAGGTSPTPPSTEKARIVTVGGVQISDASYRDANGERASIRAALTGPTLINLWAPWCRACLEELGEFAERESEFRAAGLNVLALNVDGLKADKTAPATDARDVLDGLDFDFPAGDATPELMSKLEEVDRIVVSRTRPFPLPTSILVDADGEVAVIYKGKVDVDQVLSDVPLIDANETQARDLTVPFAGQWALNYVDDKPPADLSPPAPPQVVSHYSWLPLSVVLACLVGLIVFGVVYRRGRARISAPAH